MNSKHLAELRNFHTEKVLSRGKQFPKVEKQTSVNFLGVKHCSKLKLIPLLISNRNKYLLNSTHYGKFSMENARFLRSITKIPGKFARI